MNSKSNFLTKLEQMVETEKFETVLEYAYNAEDRDLDLYETLKFILERKTPYYKRKMIKNCLSEPYSKWFETLFKYEKEWETNKYFKAKNPELDQLDREDIFEDRFYEAMSKYPYEQLMDFFVNLAVVEHKDDYKFDAVSPYLYPIFGSDFRASVLYHIVLELMKRGEFVEALSLVDTTTYFWEMYDMIDLEDDVANNWKKLLPCLEELPKHFQNIILKKYVMQSIEDVLALSKENEIAAKYLWNAIGENLLRLKGDYNEMKKAVNRIKDEGYTLSEIYSNASEYISKRMTEQICYDEEDNREYYDGVIDKSDYLWRYDEEYVSVYGFTSDHNYELSSKVLKEICEN